MLVLFRAGIGSYVDWQGHTANAYERRTQALASDPCQWVSMSAKSDRHTRVGGPCVGGVVGAAIWSGINVGRGDHGKRAVVFGLRHLFD
jgi:hypothetical protein